jgi:septum formation protein
MLRSKLHNYNIILASQSPRRKGLLSEIGIIYSTAVDHNLDESYPDGLDKFQIPVHLSEKKSSVYGQLSGNDLLITADTIVWMEGEVIGKPAGADEAVTMLRKLSGRMHEVITGVTLRTKDKMQSFHSLTEVFFADLSEEEIDHYVKKYKPYDKAGAYGIQEWIGYVGVERINGSYQNVMGLPVQKLYRVLEDFIEEA